jgi:hypothetical protein
MNINWLAAVPIGLLSLFFVLLAFRRGVRFFDHESPAGKTERFRDIFLSIFDLTSAAFGILIVIFPIKMWPVGILCGLGLFVFVLPISILGSYWQLSVSGFMPKNAGIRISAEETLPENKGKWLAWYEFIPFAYLIGWIVFFLVTVVLGFTGSLSENTTTILSIIAGTAAGALVSLVAFLKSRTAYR